MDTDKTEVSPYLVSSEPNDNAKPPYFTTEMIFIIICVILLIFALMYYLSDSSSSFLNPGYRSDPQMDDSYLESQIEFLNDMQDRNLAKM
jgi:hypothetical protein